ncbi:MAG: type II secretion system protein GspK, partial [Planctomycetaceae bacterium]|nr:type II secretion system protein GspK [Planctomycetaceae bacterium]
DDDPRDYGAESDYYEGLDPPYKARNGMIESIDELAMVNGVTPALLYGADWNRNGFIDTAEPDPQTLFGDNTSDPDELLDCGLAPYLTVSSAENQKATDGSDKINVNADDLTTLQSQLTQKLNNADQVNYILAYRLFGTTSLAVTDESESDNTTNTADSQSRSSSGNSQNNSQGSSQDNGSGSQDGSSTDNSGSQSSSSGANQGSGTNTSQSFDLTQTPQAKIFSVLDLVGGSLQVRYSGSTTTETLTSPFTEASVATDMPVLLDAIKFDDGEYSRVNINQAPKAVLLAIPGMTDEAADAIIANRISDPIELADADITEMQYPIWPLLLEYIDFDTMKAIAPYVTTQGTVMSAQIVGRFDAKSPAARLKVWFDTSVKPAKILKIQDLSDLGPGFAADVLGVNQNTQATFSTGSAVQNAMY